LITVFVHQNGSTRCVDRVDPDWLRAESDTKLWVDLSDPTKEEGKILSGVFHFHELSIEDAMSEIHHPKVESYGAYIYVILHGIDFKAREHAFRTKDVDFFLGPNYLVTVHPGLSRSIGKMAEICGKNSRMLGEGTDALMHRIVDSMVDNYRPEVDKLQDRLDKLEGEVFGSSNRNLAKRILDFKRDVSSLRRVVQPQRDVVNRLGRREFPLISEPVSYRFRDVYDHIVRLNEEAMFLQDRIASLLDAHLSTVSNQLNGVMKVLTIITTTFMPLTFITGLYGMNVDLPLWGLSHDQVFWMLLVVMLSVSCGMLLIFRKIGWL
jgi:magnesium transporter